MPRRAGQLPNLVGFEHVGKDLHGGNADPFSRYYLKDSFKHLVPTKLWFVADFGFVETFEHPIQAFEHEFGDKKHSEKHTPPSAKSSGNLAVDANGRKLQQLPNLPVNLPNLPVGLPDVQKTLSSVEKSLPVGLPNVGLPNVGLPTGRKLQQLPNLPTGLPSLPTGLPNVEKSLPAGLPNAGGLPQPVSSAAKGATGRKMLQLPLGLDQTLSSVEKSLPLGLGGVLGGVTGGAAQPVNNAANTAKSATGQNPAGLLG
ncbi:hypothetical protein WJX73_009879 [Symbiochloris irregularis]|uniref:Uncharacterized protein n=1 Tax=Symbiochloris irregularis TaxID=706552 RepID=A0AAW1NNL1_9CHLO